MVRTLRLATVGLVAAAVAAAALLTGCSAFSAGQANTGNAANPVAAGGPSSAPTGQDSQVAGVFTDVLQARTVPKMGKVAADKDGWVLYRFDKDKPGAKTSACTGKCVETWPPLLTDGTPILRGIDGTKVGVIVRDDGGRQLTLGGWPLYRYIGDPKPGNWTGQGVMGTWWVSDPTGKKNLTCVPKGTPTPAALPTYVPPTKKSDPSQTGGAGGGGY